MKGYRKLAAHLSTYPGEILLRSYRELNIKSLLYYQAELAHLESELNEAETEDAASSDTTRKRYEIDWKDLASPDDPDHVENGSRHTTPKGHCHQYLIVLKIRRVLSDYSRS